MARAGFVNGTFDILHIGHIKLLEYAKSHCDKLFVAIDNDERVAKLKGPSRPINTAWERRQMLLALKAVDEVEIFDDEVELAMWAKQIRPYVMVVGSEYKDKTVYGSEWARHLIFFDRIDEYSTTDKIQDIITRG